ncbi:hypothetical protein [Tenacibaculum amylolyticum]|uniref:hypothetical protein n=1 Tax=Tenacibaculum amylolyticum TaxID=104269 RepID=UPI003894AF48
MKKVILLITFSLCALFSFSQEKNIEWSGETAYFPNHQENQVSYINFGDAQLWGWIEVTITSSYSYRLSTGKYTKRFQIGKNQGATGYFTKASEIAASFGPIADEWKLGEFEFVNGNLRIPIYHLLTTQNKLDIRITGMTVTAYDTSNISISPVTTLVNDETADIVSLERGVSLRKIDLKPIQGNWLTGKNDTRGISATQQKHDNYQSLIRQKTANGHVINLGGIGDVFGFFGYDKNRTVNGTDYQMVMNLNNGYVGIGELSPQAKLVLKENNQVLNFLVNKKLTGTWPATNEHTTMTIQSSGVSSGNLAFANGNRESMRITASGNVGIGTTNVPSSYKLAVAGKVISEEVTVKLQSNWPDYVFTDNYKLPTLEEVEKHILEKGHLVNIPSAKEVEKKGVELGEMNKKLLEKIEELTLYTIEQEKKIINQERKLKKEEEKNKKLEERLTKIEEFLQQNR